MRQHSSNWLLRNARVARRPAEALPLDIEIVNGRIKALLPPGNELGPVHAEIVDLEGCLILPGLINAHDHLEFSLFPKLGVGPYPNAKAWAEDVYRPAEPPIANHLRVPKRERLLWGALKNLLGALPRSAITTPTKKFSSTISRFAW